MYKRQNLYQYLTRGWFVTEGRNVSGGPAWSLAGQGIELFNEVVGEHGYSMSEYNLDYDHIIGRLNTEVFGGVFPRPSFTGVDGSGASDWVRAFLDPANHRDTWRNGTAAPKDSLSLHFYCPWPGSCLLYTSPSPRD